LHGSGHYIGSALQNHDLETRENKLKEVVIASQCHVHGQTSLACPCQASSYLSSITSLENWNLKMMGILTARGEMEERMRAPHPRPRQSNFFHPYLGDYSLCFPAVLSLVLLRSFYSIRSFHRQKMGLVPSVLGLPRHA
jgi:hypothetical protein